MRKILFRGKEKHTGEWYHGSLANVGHGYCEEIPFIAYFRGHIGNGKSAMGFSCNFFEIDLQTIGQFTGLKDMNGKSIFEGDIVRVHDTLPDIADEFRNFTGAVEYRDNAFVIVSDPFTHYRWIDYEIEVIGNIYDNPELLKSEVTE